MDSMLQRAGSPDGFVRDTEEQVASDFDDDEDVQQASRRLQQLSAALIKAQHCPALASLPIEQLRQLLAQLMKYSAAAQSTLLGLGEEVGAGSTSSIRILPVQQLLQAKDVRIQEWCMQCCSAQPRSRGGASHSRLHFQVSRSDLRRQTPTMRMPLGWVWMHVWLPCGCS